LLNVRDEVQSAVWIRGSVTWFTAQQQHIQATATRT